MEMTRRDKRSCGPVPGSLESPLSVSQTLRYTGASPLGC